MEDYYYTGPLDYLLFEGELAQGTDKPPTTVIRKKPSNIPGQDTWTGFGYMEVFEGATLTFHVPDIYRSMDYFPIIRYQHEASHPTDWEQATFELERMDGDPDPNGPCVGAVDTFQVSLQAGELNTENTANPFCLESGKRYNVKITFDHWISANPTPGAKILIDSVSSKDFEYIFTCFRQKKDGKGFLLKLLKRQNQVKKCVDLLSLTSKFRSFCYQTSTIFPS